MCLALVFGTGGVLWSSRASVKAFQDISSSTGIRAMLENDATPEKHQIETMAGGVAVFDYDGDGKPDIYLVNGANQPELTKTPARFWNRLYRNLGNGRFEDSTEKAGVQGRGYEFGAAAADYDNDGDQDLFVAGLNKSLLYRNRGNGAFEEVGSASGISGGPWAIGAGWFDYDLDGWLDLFVVNYVKWDPVKEPFCGDSVARKYRTYCHPQYYEPLPNRLFKNNADGTFRDVTAESGIGAHAGKGMGIAFADHDGDGDTDVFVANDTVPNFLFENLGNGKFKETGVQAGVGFNDDGRALSSMGADFRDVDNDGRPDLFVTALANETYPLFRNVGRGLYQDITYPSRIGAATISLSGWGAGIHDFDNDGRKDLFAANGDVQTNTELFSSRKSRQPSAVLWNREDGFSIETVSAPALHRGAAFADLDGDGWLDVAASRIGEPPLVLRNVPREGRHWIGIRLRGKRSNRDGIGAVVRADGQWNEVTTAGSYSSSSPPIVHFGLGKKDEIGELEIRWPGGTVQRLSKVKADRYLEVTEP